MKTDIHPEYVEAHVRCTCGNEFTTRSTQPEIHVEICSNCHPFYTGKQKLVDTGGRVERFQRRAAKRARPRRSEPAHVQPTASRLPDGGPRWPSATRPSAAGRARGRDDARRLDVGRRRAQAAARADRRGRHRPRGGAHGEIEVTSFPLDLGAQAPPRCCACRSSAASSRSVESLEIGFKALGISANAQLPEEEEEISGGMWVGTVVVALALAIGLFFVVPVGLTSLIKDQLGSSFLFWLVEGDRCAPRSSSATCCCSRACATCAASSSTTAPSTRRSPATRPGSTLTPENAQRFSRLHPRCGTSFLLIVMIVAIFVFAPIGLPAWYWLVLTRIVGVPLIAGISFEIIKFAGRNRRRRWVRAVMWPGLQLQKLTTREPDLDQLAVAIAAHGGGARGRGPARRLRRGPDRHGGRRLGSCRP